MDWLCHPWFAPTNLCYRFVIVKLCHRLVQYYQGPSPKTPWKFTNLEQHLTSLVLYMLRLSQSLWASSLWFELAMGWVAWIRSRLVQQLSLYQQLRLCISCVHDGWHPQSTTLFSKFPPKKSTISQAWPFPPFAVVRHGASLVVMGCRGLNRLNGWETWWAWAPWYGRI